MSKAVEIAVPSFAKLEALGADAGRYFDTLFDECDDALAKADASGDANGRAAWQQHRAELDKRHAEYFGAKECGVSLAGLDFNNSDEVTISTSKVRRSVAHPGDIIPRCKQSLESFAEAYTHTCGSDDGASRLTARAIDGYLFEGDARLFEEGVEMLIAVASYATDERATWARDILAQVLDKARRRGTQEAA